MGTVGHWQRESVGGTRIDVWLRTDGRRWEVERREDAQRPRSARRTYATEAEARAVLAEWLGDLTNWTDASGQG
jgi:hypothetical protein